MTATSIPALLEPIQARLDAATPGPWQIEYLDEGIAEIATPDGGHVAIADGRQADAEFIAASPTDTARLLAAVKAVVAESGEVVTDSEGLGLDFQEDDFDRGYHAARRQTVQQILDAVEAALRCEA